jgi:phenylacetic acid degradation operon negative regulatory protein
MDVTLQRMWKAFHHPDISLPVVRRRIGQELLETLEFLGDMTLHHMHAVMRNETAPDNKARNRAINRLAKQGLAVASQGLETPMLAISKEGMDSLQDYSRPEAWWSRKWNGIWYLLVFDIPEVDRAYRNTLRAFLKKMRLGCFQKSVWITPLDIRPQYDDLAEAAAVDAFACLFEAKTVLGMPSEKVVWESWDMDRLYDIQSHWCPVKIFKYSPQLPFIDSPDSTKPQ